MKYILLSLIKLYRLLPFASHKYCRFTPTCSMYAYIAIDKFGWIKGTCLAFKRIIKCRPKGGYGYDPVPKEIL